MSLNSSPTPVRMMKAPKMMNSTTKDAEMLIGIV